MFTTNNTTAEIHLDHAVTVLRNLSSTSNIRYTRISEKDFNSLIDRCVETPLFFFSGFTGNKQNDKDKIYNLQKRDPKGTKRKGTGKGYSQTALKKPKGICYDCGQYWHMLGDPVCKLHSRYFENPMKNNKNNDDSIDDDGEGFFDKHSGKKTGKRE